MRRLNVSKVQTKELKNVYRQNIPLQFDPEVESSFQKIVLEKNSLKAKAKICGVYTCQKNNVRIGWPFLMNETLDKVLSF